MKNESGKFSSGPTGTGRSSLDSRSEEGLRRALSSRQVQMLAIGGVIGVGLFYGASLAVQIAGPAVLIGFLLCGFVAMIVMRALGEMTVERPLSGSFRQFAHEQLGPTVGFVTGGMWWFFWTATVMSELAAIGKLMQFWFPGFPVWLPSLIALVLFTVSNLLAVRVFGEVEYWFAVVKVLAVSVFILFGALLVCTGLFNGGTVVGLSNLWGNGGFVPNGWVSVLTCLSLVVQTYSGIETLAVEAGESRNPRKNMKRAFQAVSLRIVVLYVGSIFIMLCAFPWNQLVHYSGSPYVLLFAKIGIPLAASVVNLIIIMSGLSSCNTGLYGGSRMLFSMAREGDVSGKLAKLNGHNVPHIAVWTTALMISLGTIVSYAAPNYVYIWITSASAFASLWTWGIILISELKFHKRAVNAGTQLQFPMPLWPVLPIVGIVLLCIAVYAIVTSPLTRVSVWSGLIWLCILFLYAKLRRRES